MASMANIITKNALSSETLNDKGILNTAVALAREGNDDVTQVMKVWLPINALFS